MKSLLLSGITLVLIAALSAYGQSAADAAIENYRFDFTGGGARAEGMGKAFLAVSDDNTAGSWNPAGQYLLERPILSLSYGSLSPRGNTWTAITIADSVFDHSGSFGTITSASFSAPLRIKGHPFVGSFNFTRNFDEFQAARASDAFFLPIFFVLPNGGVIEDSAFYTNEATIQLEGGLESLSFGLGTRIYGDISSGVALNVYTGQVVREEVATLHSDSVLSFFTLQVFGETFHTQVLDSNKFSGFNFTCGLKYHGDKFDAGLVVRTPFSLNIKTGRSIFQVHSINGLAIDEGSDTLYFDDILARYKIPTMVAAGLAFKPNEKLLVAADAEYRGFAATEVDVRDSLFLDPGGDNTEFFTTQDPQWKNVISFRAGMEYKLESKIGQIPLRTGFGLVPLPASSVDRTGKESTVNRLNLALGAGLWWKQIHLDWAYTYSTYDWSSRGEQWLPDGSFEQRTRDHHLNFTFTGFF